MHAPSAPNILSIVDTERGNALFLILIAVALFAALSFAVVQTRGNGNNPNSEQIKIGASQLVQYSGDIEAAVLRLRVSTGMAPTLMSFETPFLSENYTNPICSDDTCRIFMPAGGGVSYNRPEPEWLSISNNTQPHWGGWLFTGGSCVPGAGLGYDATCAANPDQLDLIAIVPYVQREICMELNEKLGVTPPNTAPPQDQGNAWINTPTFTGTFTAGEAIQSSDDAFFGRIEGCFEGGGTPPAGTYHYYKVLVER